MEKVKFLIAGDHALLVQMGDEISLEVNQKVLALQKALLSEPVEGITELVPTYASLMVHYRPEIIRYGALVKKLESYLGRETGETPESRRIIKEVPICYGQELGPDLEYCAALENTTPEEIIRKHSAHDYYVYMLGFAPGHPYSARFEEPFSFKRRETARTKIPARSVVVQTNLSDLIPLEQPCGWNIIGSTPLEICDYGREDPFLVKAGEWVRYIPVDKRTYEEIRQEVVSGRYQVKTIIEKPDNVKDGGSRGEDA